MRSHARTTARGRNWRPLRFVLWSCTIATAFPVVSEAQYKGDHIPGFLGLQSGTQAPPGLYVANVVWIYPTSTTRWPRPLKINFYGTNGSITMYAPDAKLYTTMPAKATIDDNLADITAKGIDMPVGPFLSSHLYELASKNLITGYVIGRVKIYDQDVHQLAFTSPDADWQLWVIGGESPRIVRAESVNKKLEGKPRTIVQFLEWNLSPTISADEFTFTKPADAHQVDMLTPTGGK